MNFFGSWGSYVESRGTKHLAHHTGDIHVCTTSLQGKTMDNNFFICENINIFGGPVVGGDFNNQTAHLGSHLPSL